MCALITMCTYCTEENGKLKYLKECLQSLSDTVDLEKHHLYIMDNKSSDETIDYLLKWYRDHMATIMYLPKNQGTAHGINLALLERKPRQVCIKCDDDVTWGQSGWVEELEQAIADHPEIGICGLKRKDLAQHPKHKDPNMRTVIEGRLEWCHDIMGTCTAYNPKMLDKVGYLNQPSAYGFDDNLISVRSEVAGFRNCFLRGIDIKHLDEGGTDYTEWKKREAALYIHEVAIMCDMYREGKLDIYYNGGF